MDRPLLMLSTATPNSTQNDNSHVILFFFLLIISCTVTIQTLFPLASQSPLCLLTTGITRHGSWGHSTFGGLACVIPCPCGNLGDASLFCASHVPSNMDTSTHYYHVQYSNLSQTRLSHLTIVIIAFEGSNKRNRYDNNYHKDYNNYFTTTATQNLFNHTH